MENEPIEMHPYRDFIVPNSKIFIIGTFPIGKFTNPERKDEITSKDVDFFYGGATNPFWPILSEVFKEDLSTKKLRQEFLTNKMISMVDVVFSARRKDGGPLDKDLYDITWNIGLKQVLLNSGNPKIYFTSKNAQNWFFKNILDYIGETILLKATANAALIQLSRSEECKNWISQNPGSKPKDYRLFLYKKLFGQNN